MSDERRDDKASSRNVHSKFVADHADQTMGRRCLFCGKEFVSSWTGERICKDCKSTNTWKTG